MKAFKAELSKLLSLPYIWLALLLGAFAPALFAVLDNFAEKEDIIAGISTRLSEVGYIGLAFGVQGVIIVGVLAVSSEYVRESNENGGGQQLTTSLSVVPSRLSFMLAKGGAVTVISILLCAVAIFTTLTVTRLILGEYAPTFDWSKLLGVVCYWVLTALLASGLTFITKSGVIPLTVLMINSSVVSLSVVLSKVTKLAYYLPDRAGIDMFMSMSDSVHTPLAGGFVMAAWVVVFFIIAAIVFHRRDVAA